MAFHAIPRFTREIDILVRSDDMDTLTAALDKLGYQKTAEPWTLDNSTLTRHRFLKIEGDDEFLIDILVADSEEHYKIIRNADFAEVEDWDCTHRHQVGFDMAQKISKFGPGPSRYFGA